MYLPSLCIALARSSIVSAEMGELPAGSPPAIPSTSQYPAFAFVQPTGVATCWKRSSNLARTSFTVLDPTASRAPMTPSAPFTASGSGLPVESRKESSCTHPVSQPYPLPWRILLL